MTNKKQQQINAPTDYMFEMLKKIVDAQFREQVIARELKQK